MWTGLIWHMVWSNEYVNSVTNYGFYNKQREIFVTTSTSALLNGMSSY